MHKTIDLTTRREIIDLLLFYKHLDNYVDCNYSSYFELIGSLHSLRSSSNDTLLRLDYLESKLLPSNLPIFIA